MIQSFLLRTRILLGKVNSPSEHTFLPAVSAIRSVYAGYHALSLGRQVGLETLFPSLDEKPVWASQAEDVCQLIAGVVGWQSHL